jgi:DNA-binding LacI/PurR family transcriptional regulator
MGKPRRTRIVEVAEAAGVSPTTVSHALNGRGQVSVATRARVEAAAERLSYRPSRAARTLRTATTETVGFVLPEFEVTAPLGVKTITLDNYMQLIRSASLTAFRRGYRFLMAPRVSSPDEVADLGVDGAIICDPLEHDSQLEFFAAANVPVVTYERPLDRPDFRWHVGADNGNVVRRLLEHLTEQGGTRIAMILPDLPSPTVGECKQAYLDWCEERGISPLLEVIKDPEGPEARERVEALLRSTEPPDAILDGVPPRALEACRDAGLSVPEDVLIAAFFDSPDTRGAEPAITAIDLNPTAVGESAMDLLVDLIEGQHPEGPIFVPAPMYVRGSTSRVES